MDQDKKTMRHFYCRDVLWETFEAMANDFDCSIDYLVNESMRIYARSKNYQVPGAANPSQIISATSPGSPLRPTMGSSPGLRPVAPGPATPPAPAPMPMAPPLPVSAPLAPPRPPMPPAPASGRNATLPPGLGGRPPVPTPPSNPNQSSGSMAAPSAASPPPSSWSPPLSPSAPPGSIETAAPPLYLMFQGQRMLVDKDQFVIGRGSKTADLAIKDGNISRKHAVVLRRNGVYYIKDLGSTNGIEYKGMRIDNKRIDEGDSFSICDYELRFTYQPT
jgi:hypothetical protein